MTATNVLDALAGGGLIGLGAAVFLLALGRIAGISGVLAGAVGLSGASSRALSRAFVIGLLCGALAASRAVPGLILHFPHSPLLLMLGGLAVGYGTRLGSGCTSGHGVCGLSRLSLRSLFATATFMAVGIATVSLMNALGISW